MPESGIEPFTIRVADAQLADLRDRLSRARWPEAEPVGDWSQGVPIASLQALCEHWQHRYDWRRCEAMLNAWDPQRTEIDGLGIAFHHIRSPEPDALPVIMTHGWPGSVVEFNKVVGPLTDPAAHGGRREDALHLILPHLPGYGFSDKPAETGWSLPRIADAWIELMRRLGYGDRWGTQGGDWGAAVALAIADKAPAGCVGCHFNLAFVQPTPEQVVNADPKERAILDRLKLFDKEQSGYAKEQSTRPQTIGYALADTPIGQAAWIYEKFYEWTDNDGSPETVLSLDELLDNITLYWLTNSGASSARLYWESLAQLDTGQRIEMPVAFSVFPKENVRTSRRWADSKYANIAYFNDAIARGGHFAAFEQPAVFVDEVRAAFRAMRPRRSEA
ncbi:epoxide hydrolase family protein [Sphingomonas sp.]|uniref:epoxide hydrolase family protein n=1 Tax=Sphingomonas sp. TaxID=28214 RepID=UPI003AFFB9F5